MGLTRRLLAAALILGLGGASSPAASPIRPLAGVRTWVVYYAAAPEAAVDLARFDVVVNFSTDLVATDEQLAPLLDAVAGGTGFVGLHAANATFRASDAYAAMVGSRFARHPPIKRFTVEIVDPSHPVTAGLQSFEVEDERYELKDEASDLRILARAEGHASVYVRRHGRGRPAAA